MLLFLKETGWMFCFYQQFFVICWYFWGFCQKKVFWFVGCYGL